MTASRSAAPQIFEGTIRACKNQYLIQHSVNIKHSMVSGGNGLVDVYTGSLAVLTGLDDGDIHLRLELHESEPPLDLEAWDEIVDVSFHAEKPLFLEQLFGGGAEDFPPLNFKGQSDYRIRVCARGRDEANRTFESVEFHAIQVWSDTFGPPTSHQFRDAFGERWRQRAQARTRPPGPTASDR